MPRADEPRVMVRLSAGMDADLQAWVERHGLKSKAAILRRAVQMVGEDAARAEASARAVRVRRAAPARSRPGGAAKTSPAPPASIPSRDELKTPPAAAGVDRADAFRAIEERRRALRG